MGRLSGAYEKDRYRLAEDSMVTKAPATRRSAVVTRWQTGYAMRLLITDVTVVAVAVLLAQYIRFGHSPLDGVYGFAGSRATLFSAALITLWILALSVFQTRSATVLGVGFDEYRRVVSASFWIFGFVAIASLLFKLGPSRGYLAVALPVGTIGLLIARWLWRKQTIRRRKHGDWQTPLMVLGDRASVSALVADLLHNSDHVFNVVGVGLYGHATNEDHLEVDGVRIPILGDETKALESVKECGAHTVALTGTEHFGSTGIRNLLWDLEAKDVDLVVSPTATRLVMQPMPGYPLLHVERPQYQEAKRFHKRALDFAFASAALVLASPLLLLAAIAIKLTSRGPVFYSAERVGLDGEQFTMYKLRTMTNNADALLADLAAKNESPGGVLFKLREDPRITPVGKILRRFSIDEIPQFFNVIKGDMSVVGPRPPLQREVVNYDGAVKRRLLVRPGVTGLWQVSGRSDLPWDESVRLDLSYVENWSMGTDLVIILKTVRAVLGRVGAY
jgi:exopolysaccharide biosynthesis polyprenyl glycosylphosphotransferase